MEQRRCRFRDQKTRLDWLGISWKAAEKTMERYEGLLMEILGGSSC